MIYIIEVTRKIQIINKVLQEINAPTLLENPDFLIDGMSCDSWLKIDLNRKSNNIPLSLILTPTELEIRLDRIGEAVVWSDIQIEKFTSKVSIMLKNLFTSHILVESYGSALTIISLFEYSGSRTNRFIYFELFYAIRKHKKILYDPIYNISSLEA